MASRILQLQENLFTSELVCYNNLHYIMYLIKTSRKLLSLLDLIFCAMLRSRI